MSKFLIVGANFSAMRQYLDEHGHDYVTLKDKLHAKHPEKKLKRRMVCDFTTTKSILSTVDKLGQKQPFDGVLAMYENYILPAARVAHHLRLPGLPIESAEACTDKLLMRQRFATAKEPISPDFATADSERAVTAFADQHGFPLILKPANLAKSLLVTKNHNLEELLTNYQRTAEKIDSVYQRYAPNRIPKLVIEQFLEGSIHSVEAFIDKHGEPQVLEVVVDYQTGYDIGFSDNFHYSRLVPSQLPAQTIQAIRHIAAVGCRALGMKNSPAHVEIILTPKGPRIVEIGARNGGYRSRMHDLANGIDIAGNMLKLALGEQPQLKATRHEKCSVLELFPKEAGIYAGLENEERLRKLPSLVYLNLKTAVGEYIGKAAEGHKMCAVVMLHNSDPDQFEHDLRFVNTNVRIRTAG